MTSPRSAEARIVAEVGSWPGVRIEPEGDLGETAFLIGDREIGHLHGGHTAHFSFPRRLWGQLRDEGRIEPHPAFPDVHQGPSARPIDDDDDVRDVIELFRMNYERVAARRDPCPERVTLSSRCVPTRCRRRPPRRVGRAARPVPGCS